MERALHLDDNVDFIFSNAIAQMSPQSCDSTKSNQTQLARDLLLGINATTDRAVIPQNLVKHS